MKLSFLINVVEKNLVKRIKILNFIFCLLREFNCI